MADEDLENEDLEHDGDGPDDVDDDGADGTERDDEGDNEGDDAGSEGEEGEGEEAAEEGSDPEPRQARRESRAERRIRALDERARAAEERAARAEAAANARSGVDAEAQRRAEEQREQEQLAAMSESERITYHMAKEIKKTQNMVADMRRQTFDATDRATFHAKYSGNTKLKKFVDQAEKVYQGLVRSQPGIETNRETVLAYVIGQEMLNNGGNIAAQVRRQGQRRINGARATPGSARSNVSSSSGNRGSLTARMERDDPAI